MKPGTITSSNLSMSSLDPATSVKIVRGNGGVRKCKRGSATGGQNNSSTPGGARTVSLIARHNHEQWVARGCPVVAA